jgi:single-strand DNA-binding protein
MKGLNRVILVGNLGKDPEVKKVGEGLTVTRISVATSEFFRLKNGDLYADTQWHTVIFWRSLAELAGKFLKKGSLVYLEGKLKTRSYQDINGAKRFVAEVVGDKFVLLDKRVPLREMDDLDDLFEEPPPF